MATAFEDDDDVPPLEDMSGLLDQIKTLECGKQSKETFSHGNNEILPIEKPKSCAPKEQSTESKRETFGGFQKGFLNRKGKDKTASPKHTKTSSKDETIPVVSPKKDSNNLRFPEVQKAMETASVLHNKEWVTDDLLKKLEGRPDLLKKLADPRYFQALSLFQSNPDKGWKLVQDNQELQTFIKDFCGILGEHFTSMAEPTNSSEVDGKASVSPQTSASKADEEKMSEILSDPATLEVLKDPWISKLIKNLKENPTEARRMLATSRPEVLPKIKKLIDAGILSYG